MPRKLMLLLLTLVCLLLGLGQALAAQPTDAGRMAPYDGGQVYYELLGQGPTTVVLIHGWSCDGTIWRNQIADLAKAHQVLVVDLPGHGRSDKPRTNYTQDYLAGGVLAAMDQAGVQKAVLAGHSMGASVARRLALTHPDRVAGLVSVDGAMFPTPKHAELRRQWDQQMAGFAAGLEKDQDGKFTREFVSSMFVPDTPADTRKLVLDMMTSTPLHVRLSCMKGMGDPAIWGDDPVKAPVMVVEAENEQLPQGWQAMVAEVYPNLEYHTLSGVGHFFLLWKPQALNPLMLQFQDRVAGQ